MHLLSDLPGLLRADMVALGDQLGDGTHAQRAQLQRGGLQRCWQGKRSADRRRVVALDQDQQQIIGCVGQQLPQHLPARIIRPVDVVETQYQRLAWPTQHPQQLDDGALLLEQGQARGLFR